MSLRTCGERKYSGGKVCALSGNFKTIHTPEQNKKLNEKFDAFLTSGVPLILEYVFPNYLKETSNSYKSPKLKQHVKLQRPRRSNIMKKGKLKMNYQTDRKMPHMAKTDCRPTFAGW